MHSSNVRGGGGCHSIVSKFQVIRISVRFLLRVNVCILRVAIAADADDGD